MIQLINKVNWGVLMLFVSFQLSYGQDLSGSNLVESNSVESYGFSNGRVLSLPSWEVTGGTILNTSSQGSEYAASIQWGSVGSGTVTFKSGGLVEEVMNVTITDAGPDIPTPDLIIQPTCTTATGSFTILNYNASYTYATSPSSGVTISGGVVTAPPGTYTVTATFGNNTSAPSESVTINPEPTPPSTATGSGNSRCGAGTVNLSATPGSNGNTIRWYAAISGGSVLATSTSFTTPSISSTTTYYAASYNSITECEAVSREAITATINQIPSTPTGGGERCGTGSVTLTASGVSGAIYKWYTASDSYITSGPSYTTPTLSGNTTYKVSATVNGCEGPKANVTATVNPTPGVASANNPLPQCGPNVFSFTATPGTNSNTIKWYTAASGGTLLQTGTSFTTPTALNTTTTYYAASYNSSTQCEDTDRIAVTATVNPIPGDASASNPVPKCDPSIVTFTAAQGTNSNNIKWYTAASGGTLIHTGTSYTTPTALNSTTAYYAASYNSSTQCESVNRIAVTAIINTSSTWYADTDNDGYGDPNSSQQVCVAPIDYVDNSDDIDDSNKFITNIPPKTFYRDNDGDTYGDATNTKYESVRPTGYVTDNTDCNDNDVNVHTVTTWYLDADGDGYYTSVLNSCSGPGTGWTNSSGLQPGDCDDSTHSATNDCSTTTDPNDRNYVHTRVYQTEDAGETIESIAYFDGLGRPEQNIAIRAGGSQEDIVTHIAYDNFGRMDKEYLPYASPTQDGAFRTDALSATNSFYSTTKYENTANPYSEKHLENSPLNRVLKQAAPGNPWALNENGADNAIEFDYRSNTANDDVRLFNVDLTPTTVSGTITYEPALVLASTNGGEYEAGELYKTITRDENHSGSTKNHTTEEFRNKQGQVVLKRTYADITGQTEAPHDTYYVYDDYGNLSYVLPPKMDATTANIATINGQMNDLGYRYKYDRRNRLVEKRIPGKGWEYIVYNKLDQPIMTRDANLGAADQWLFTKYDAFGRVAYTGLATDNGTRQAVQAEVDALTGDLWVTKGAATTYGGTALHYGNTAYPTAALTEVYTINYYDDYDFLASETDFSLPAQGFLKDIENHDNLDKTLTKGLATGSRVRVLGTDDWIVTVTGYDDKGRAIYTESRNSYLQTTDIVESQLDFTGKPLKVKTRHIKDGTTLATLESFAYDHMGRSESRTQCIGDASMAYSCGTSGNLVVSSNSNVVPNIVANTSITIKNVTITDGTRVYIDPNVANNGAANNMELIALNTYDGLGRLESKKVGGEAAASVSSSIGLQTVDYTYNIRGWLTDINDVNSTEKLFNFSIAYDQGPNPLYNGNISRTQWRTKNDDDSSLKYYDYSYDALNRITAATGGTNSNYDVTGIDYDKNGNIRHLNRKGHTNVGATTFGDMDNLTYTYDSGNKLLSVTDAINTPALMKGEFKDGNKIGDDYDYDDNGNLISDANKSISAIEYNHLNMPTKITVTGSNAGVVDYKYSANGIKLQKIKTQGGNTTTTDYIGNYIYENNTLKQFSHPEGYVKPDGSGGFDYIYNYLDHLGNVRLSYSDLNNDGSINANTEILQERNYYPFGMLHSGYNTNIVGVENNHQTYNGKEWNESLGLNLYEMDMRQYDPAIARWTSIDPVTHWSMSTYTAFDNNPVYFVDPSGANSGTMRLQDLDGNWHTLTEGEDYTTIYEASDSSDTDSSSDDCPPGDPNCSKKEDGTIQNQYEMSVDADDMVSEEMASFLLALPKVDGGLPFGDGVAATIGLNILVAYAIAHGSVGIINSINESVLAAADANWVYAKQEKEINRIMSKEGGPPGMTYMLTVNQATTTFDVRGNPITLQAGEVWKYGETTKGFGRYSDTTLKNMVPGGVTMQPLFFGNTVQIKVQEKIMIYGHFLATGSLPPGNKIFR